MPSSHTSTRCPSGSWILLLWCCSFSSLRPLVAHRCLVLSVVVSAPPPSSAFWNSQKKSYRLATCSSLLVDIVGTVCHHFQPSISTAGPWAALLVWIPACFAFLALWMPPLGSNPLALVPGWCLDVPRHSAGLAFVPGTGCWMPSPTSLLPHHHDVSYGHKHELKVLTYLPVCILTFLAIVHAFWALCASMLDPTIHHLGFQPLPPFSTRPNGSLDVAHYTPPPQNNLAHFRAL